MSLCIHLQLRRVNNGRLLSLFRAGSRRYTALLAAHQILPRFLPSSLSAVVPRGEVPGHTPPLLGHVGKE
jgi:hypothetical protein